MLGKKKETVVWSAEDYRMNELVHSLCKHMRVMQTYCHEIIVRKGSAEMLPDGADKNLELQEIETYQKKILNLIAAYDDDLRQYNQIDASLLRYYASKTKQLTSHEVLHVAWKWAYKEVMNTLR